MENNKTGLLIRNLIAFLLMITGLGFAIQSCWMWYLYFLYESPGAFTKTGIVFVGGSLFIFLVGWFLKKPIDADIKKEEE